MYKLSIILLLALAHIARSADELSAAAAQSIKIETCQGPKGVYQPGERYCVDDNTNRVCKHGGEWHEHKCDDDSKCQEIGDKKVQCLRHHHIDYPTGPPAGFDASGLVPVGKPIGDRRRRNVDAMANKDPAGAVPQNDQGLQAAPAAKPDVCTGAPYGSAQPNDRYCLNEKTSRVCGYGGEWFDFQCDEGSKCVPLDKDNKKVQCLVHNHISYPTGPPPGHDGTGEVNVGRPTGERRRRNTDAMASANKDTAGAAPQQAPQAEAPQAEAPQAAPAAPAKPDVCSGAPYGSAQPGDRYCLNEKTSRVCGWGGEWTEYQCDERSKCVTLEKDNKKVQCLVHEHISYPTGPPPGHDGTGEVNVGRPIGERRRR